MAPSLRKVHRNKPERFQPVKPRIEMMKNKMLTTVNSTLEIGQQFFEIYCKLFTWKLFPKFIVTMKCIFFNHNSATPVVEINFPVTTCTAYKKLFFPLSSDSAISACGFFSLCATPSCYISVNIIAVSWICLHPKKDDDDDHICKGNHLYSGKSL